MLASKYRLSGKKIFEKVLKEGRFVQSPSFGVAYLEDDSSDISHFGFVVSTKVSKEAVTRNRVKRALSEAVRFLMDKINKSYNVVFLAKGNSTKASTDVLMGEVREALQKAGITNNWK